MFSSIFLFNQRDCIMFENYLKIAARNLLRHKGYSFINAAGLMIGMACCLLILLYVQDELSYDRYHEHADRIYRVDGAFRMGGNDFDTATISAPVAEVLVRDFPEVVDAARFRGRGSFIIQYEDRNFREQRIIFADSTLFNLFTIPFIEGNPKTALAAPNTIVLNRTMAEKYFGSGSALGKSLRLDNRDDYTVTGVFEDMPHNSHFRFDFFASLCSIEESREQTWFSNNFNTYLLLHEEADPAALEAKFPALLRQYMGAEAERVFGVPYEDFLKAGDIRAGFSLQKLTDIHLKSDLIAELGQNNDIKYVYIFSAIAFFILVIASINFINLSTARSSGRAREVGIRKVLGSYRRQLITQFLTESMIMSIIALVGALVLVAIALPYFNNLANKEMLMSSLFGGSMTASMIIIVLLVGILAGLYPALYISAFKPVSILKGSRGSGGGKGLLRSGLVVFQFAASIILIIGTIVVLNQLNYVQNKKLGYDKNQVLILDNAYLLSGRIETFKNELVTDARIENATISGYLPIPSNRNSTAVFPEGRFDDSQSTSLQCWNVDVDYVKTMGMNILAGRDFSEELASDSTAVIINQETIKQFGWDDPLGKRVSRFMNTQGDVETFTVIGVVEDFHFESLRNTITPLILFLAPSRGNISFRVQAADIPGVINLIRETWNKFLPGQPFEYSFLNERFDELYRTEQRLSKIFSIFAGLAIFIACLGLLGLASYMAEQRTKEIGIRKVLGASIGNIIFMMSREFTKWVVLANIFAWPAAWYIMNRWLEDFAYRVGIGWSTFLLAGVLALLFALVTVSYQAVRAARTNPADSIRYE